MSNSIARFIGKLLINAIGLVVAAFLVPNFHLDTKGENGFLYVLLVALILALINTFIRPIVRLASIPLNILSVGLFSFVMNGVLLLLLAFVVGQIQSAPYAIRLDKFPPDLSVDAFVAAILGAIVISIVSTVMAFVIPD